MLTLMLLLFACTPKPAETSSASSSRLDWPAGCPDPSDPEVHYKHETWKERDMCERIRFACEDGQSPIESPPGVECGCGCIDVAS